MADQFAAELGPFLRHQRPASLPCPFLLFLPSRTGRGLADRSTSLLFWDTVTPVLTRDCYLLVFVSMEVPVRGAGVVHPSTSATSPPVARATSRQFGRLAHFSPTVSSSVGLDRCSVQDLRTYVYSFRSSNCSRRTLLLRDGGWPYRPDDNTAVDRFWPLPARATS
ncbi:hypothetical protein ZWY2020_011355 [Hordeum vulgare]|nr:hypothetical protein ZWY2020_011355 [Hordeum vulgare]